MWRLFSYFLVGCALGSHDGLNTADLHFTDGGLVMLQLKAEKSFQKRLESQHRPDQSEPSTKDLFRTVHDKFARRYSPDGRQGPKNLSRFNVSLDFELEPHCKVLTTPEVLLDRGKIDLSGSESESLVLLDVQAAWPQWKHHKEEEGEKEEEEDLPLFPSVSKYFEVGLDGSTAREKQVMGASFEFGTITMRPRDILASTQFSEMQAFSETLWNLEHGDKIPGGSAQMSHCFVHHEDQNLTGCFNNPLCCSHCGMQFTVGVDLARVEELLQMSAAPQVVQAVETVDLLCADGSCSPEYKGLVVLSSVTLAQAHHGSTDCSHPKRQMRPWLVRTHFGDMYSAVKRMHGAAHMKEFQSHVLKASGMTASDVVLTGGLRDYLNFPEMAELAGHVVSRDANYSAQMKATQAMPVTADGLKKVAQRMVQHQHEVNHVLVRRPCGVWGRNDDANNFTALDWLDGVKNSKDIMSDADSPISKNSYSGLVWKSMGSWRLDHQHDSRVFLECRNIVECLSVLPGPFSSPAEAGSLVALAMADFEDRVTAPLP